MPTLSPAQIAGYAKAAGFTGTQVPIMTAIALAESGGRTDATNKNSDDYGSVDYGIWQINSHWNGDLLTLGDWRNPADNARMARAVFDRQGYKAWAVYNSKTYAGHLGEAQQASGKWLPPPVPFPVPKGAPNLGLLINPHTWLRVAMFIGGVTLMWWALLLMGWASLPAPVKSAAAKAAKVAITKKAL
jgi:hypothetical protein